MPIFLQTAQFVKLWEHQAQLAECWTYDQRLQVQIPSLSQFRVLVQGTLSLLLSTGSSQKQLYLCKAATASLFLTWSSPNDRENLLANSCKTKQNTLSKKEMLLLDNKQIEGGSC